MVVSVDIAKVAQVEVGRSDTGLLWCPELMAGNGSYRHDLWKASEDETLHIHMHVKGCHRARAWMIGARNIQHN